MLLCISANVSGSLSSPHCICFCCPSSQHALPHYTHRERGAYRELRALLADAPALPAAGTARVLQSLISSGGDAASTALGALREAAADRPMLRPAMLELALVAASGACGSAPGARGRVNDSSGMEQHGRSERIRAKPGLLLASRLNVEVQTLTLTLNPNTPPAGHQPLAHTCVSHIVCSPLANTHHVSYPAPLPPLPQTLMPPLAPRRCACS